MRSIGGARFSSRLGRAEGFVRVIVALLLGVFVAGCSSRYGLLKDETDATLVHKSDVHACLCAEGRDCHVSTTLAPTVGRSGVMARVAVHETGQADADTVVLIHGVFADHESWRFVAPLLAREYHVVVVDLPGCGASDAPEPTSANEADLYSPTGMAERLAQALETTVLGARGSAKKRVMIVAHSLGGFVTLRMFGDPTIRAAHLSVISGVDRLFLIAPLDGIVEKADPAFEGLWNISGFDVALGSMFGVAREKVTEVVLRSVDEQSSALRAEADKRLEILKDSGKRHAMQSMLKQAVPLVKGATRFDPDWDAMLAQAATNRNVDQPTMIVWGDRDEVMPVSMGYRLWATMPTAELRVIPKCRHSPQLEYPVACASMIVDFARSEAPASAIARSNGPAKVVDVNGVAWMRIRGRTEPSKTPETIEGGR